VVMVVRAGVLVSDGLQHGTRTLEPY
jgi:hypothetical protein